MPLVDWDSQQAWDDNYSARGQAGYVAAMTYAGLQPVGQLSDGGHPSSLMRKTDWYIARGIGAADRVLIGGAALGYTVDLMRAAGFPNVIGLEKSPHVRGLPEFDGALVAIDDDMLRGGQMRAGIRNAFGDLGFTGNNRDPQWIITEGVLESYDDVDAATILAGCEALVDGPFAQIIHVVTTTDTGPFEPPGVFNEKTLAGWSAMAPSHTWINAETGDVL